MASARFSRFGFGRAQVPVAAGGMLSLSSAVALGSDVFSGDTEDDPPLLPVGRTADLAVAVLQQLQGAGQASAVFHFQRSVAHGTRDAAGTAHQQTVAHRQVAVERARDFSRIDGDLAAEHTTFGNGDVMAVHLGFNGAFDDQRVTRGDLALQLYVRPDDEGVLGRAPLLLGCGRGGLRRLQWRRAADATLLPPVEVSAPASDCSHDGRADPSTGLPPTVGPLGRGGYGLVPLPACC